MKRLAGICALTMAIGFAALGQTSHGGQAGSVPATWTGTWKLNVEKSTFGTILVPGAPADLKITAEVLTIEHAGDELKLAGDTVFSTGGQFRSSHEDTALNLDGSESHMGPVTLSFRRIDDSTFEISSTVDIPNSNVGQVSQYVFSPDGTKLTATKIQTQRAPAPAGTDKSKGAVVKTSKFVLVYDKVPEQKPEQK